MERSAEYVGLFLTLAVSGGIACLMLLLHLFLGQRAKTRAKDNPFECGMQPFQLPRGYFGVKFYLVAMLFILFDVEIVWFFPWAVVLKELRWFGLFEMFFFLAVLIVGFVYAWKKGALEWEK